MGPKVKEVDILIPYLGLLRFQFRSWHCSCINIQNLFYSVKGFRETDPHHHKHTQTKIEYTTKYLGLLVYTY